MYGFLLVQPASCGQETMVVLAGCGTSGRLAFMVAVSDPCAHAHACVQVCVCARMGVRSLAVEDKLHRNSLSLKTSSSMFIPMSALKIYV